MADVHAMIALYEREVRRDVTPPPGGYVLEWDGVLVLRLTGPGAEVHENGVQASDLSEADADAAIARQIAHFEALGHAFEWKLHAWDRPADLAARLARSGLERGERETLVAYDATRPFPVPPAPDGVTFRRLDDPAEFARIAEPKATVYDDRDHAEWLVQSLQTEKRADSDALHVWTAEADGAVVAAGWVRLPPGRRVASLWGGATVPAWRRRGIYTTLVALRLAAVRERGYRLVTVDCSDRSLPILARRGFTPLGDVTPWIWRPPNNRDR